MTTNQTIDGVPRERIQEIICDIERGGRITAVEKLRALLDAPEVLVVPLTGPKDWLDSLKPAAQPQGEPVACTHGIRAPHACDQCAEQNDVPDYWEDPDTGTCIDQWTKIQGLNGTEAFTVPLYRHAEQPAPGAVVLDEKDEFVTWVRREWPQAPLSNVRDLLPKDDPRYGEYCNEALQRAWVGWQARAAVIAKS